MYHKRGFTLAEVLITLAIIGVVAAITIPSVIVNTNQMEFKTGLRKAVSVLNQAITLNKALTGESPYDNASLYDYLIQHMSVMNTQKIIDNDGTNKTFYTTDGMRFEVKQCNGSDGIAVYSFPLYENRNQHALLDTYRLGDGVFWCTNSGPGTCGSQGLTHNPDSTTNPPCIITIDVNGDRKPNPPSMTSLGFISEKNEYSGEMEYYEKFSVEKYKYADPKGRLLTDVFSIMITDTGAIPYGVVAQKAMYQAQK